MSNIVKSLNPKIMIPLPQNVRKNSFDYTQVLRGKKACIYEQRDKGKLISYEVMLIRIKPGRHIKGKWIEAREKFPSDEGFGYFAWIYKTMEGAWKKYNSIEND